jgi:diacylglycerol kinase (ATP)
MNQNKFQKLLFIINPYAGNKKGDIRLPIQKYFNSLQHSIHLYNLAENDSPEKIKEKTEELQPDKVIAVGGDGTVKLVAESLLQTHIPLGILPAGSANGMAKELGIPDEPKGALDIIVKGQSKKIHMVDINDHRCIHLSDIGFNAFLVKKFETQNKRGMWGYIKAAWKVLKRNPVMQVSIQVDDGYIQREAAMVVIANATKYGTGVLINPKGSLEDDFFEVVIVKKIALSEIFKMMITHSPYNPVKTELLQTRSLKIESKHKVHFQVDGEYLGKVNRITAFILPAALQIVVPAQKD